MEKIKLGVFDIFTYILPGFFMVLAIYMLAHNTNDIASLIIEKSTIINFVQTSLFLIICYVCGFINQYVAYEIFKLAANTIWKGKLKGKEISFGELEEQIVQIRHFSPTNFEALTKWFALRGMCYGLFQSMLLFDIILLIRTIQYSTWHPQRVVLMIVIIIFAFLFLRRALTFHEWAHNTLKHSINSLEDYKKYKN